MIASYLRNYLTTSVITGEEEKVGRILVEGEPEGTIWLGREGLLELGPLNPPLGPFLRFQAESIWRSLEHTQSHDWEPVSEYEVNAGLHLFLLLDPRTYDKIDSIIETDRSQILLQQDTVFVEATYPVEKMFGELNVREPELGCIVDMLGQWWQTSFSMSNERVEIFVRDPLLYGGVVVQFESSLH